MIRYETRGDIFWITIDRPEKRNALNLEGWRGITEGIDRAVEETRVAVITGVEDVFTAGDDIQLFEQLETIDEIEEFSDTVFDVFHGIEAASVPVVTAVNGLAYGGGCEIVAASDYSVAVPDATFALPEVRLGAPPTFAITRFEDYGGRKRGMELSLTGEPIDAGRALSWGLVNRVVSEEELEDAVEEFADAVCEASERAIRLTKRYATSRRWGPDDRTEFADRIVRGFATDDLQESAKDYR